MTHNFNEAEKQPSEWETNEIIEKYNDPIKLLVGANIAENCFGKDDENSISAIIHRVRESIFDEWGVMIPFVRVQDDTTLNQDEFVLSVYGSEIGRFTMPPSNILCVDIRKIPEPNKEIHGGIKTKEPLFDLPATIASAEYADEAKKSGYAVLDFSKFLELFFRELMPPHLYEFVDIGMTEKMLDGLGRNASSLPYTTEEIARLLRALLQDGINIKDLSHILSALPQKEESESLSSVYQNLRLAISETVTDSFF